LHFHSGQQLVSLINTTADHVIDQRLKRIGLLASPTTISSGLYSERLRAKGVEVITPSAIQLAKLETAIRLVIAGDQREAKPIVEAIITNLLYRGCEVVILGCTELSMVANGLPQTVDPVDLVVSRLLTSEL
jgi:aspartate racemase